MNKQWDLRAKLIKQIKAKGGWVNTHSHLDRAYTITPKMLNLANKHLHDKWLIVDEIKSKSSVSQIYDRMAFGVEEQLKQGVTVLGSFIDVDEVIKDKAMIAANKIKNAYAKDLKLVFINQALKGVLEPKAKMWFDEAISFVDIIGGLPAKDAGREEEHLDVLFEAAKKHNKMLHVHVDQLNTQKEKETELLIKKAQKYKLKNKVVAIHGISLSAHPKKYRQKIYQKMKKAGVMLISCPTAWIDAKRSEERTVTHNSIAPVEELVAAGITVGIGTDNIADVYKPFTDGDMWTELRFLLESCHFYDLDELVKIATSNGRKILGVK
jgi:cytosine/creatinine deaminase